LDNASSQLPVNVFGSILTQAAEMRPGIIDWIRPLRKEDHHLIAQNSLRMQELSALLKRTFDVFKGFIILIDALNESQSQSTILSTLLQLVRVCPNLRVLVTSIADPVSSTETSSMFLIRQMNIAAVDRDVSRYVKHRIESELAFSCLSEGTKNDIQRIITSTANGM